MSLDLDTRQRAMLHAMGIVLWQPAADTTTPAVEEQKQPSDQQKQAWAATNSIATTEHESASSFEPARPSTRPSPASASTSAIAAAPRSAPAPLAASAAAPLVALSPRPDGIDQMNWLQLQEAVTGCRACSLCASRKNTVFGVGAAPAEPALPPQADWLIVGEAPGEHEDMQGEPFVGQAGKLLDNMLRAMRVNAADGTTATGLDRHTNVYIANVLKCRPPANRNPSPEEMAMCQPYLHRQIALLRPKIIVAMGRFAVQTLLQSTDPIGKLRGRVHPVQINGHSAPVVVTYHPAYLLRNLPDKAKAWQDLVLAMQTLRSLREV
jgi:uracil-DNA glycosylase